MYVHFCKYATNTLSTFSKIPNIQHRKLKLINTLKQNDFSYYKILMTNKMFLYTSLVTICLKH